MRQSVALLNLKFLNNVGPHFFKALEIEKDAIQSLLMPGLNLDDDNPLHNGTVKEPFSPWAPFSIDPINSNGLTRTKLETTESDIRMVWEPARLQQAVLLLVFAQKNPKFPGWKQAKQAAKSIILSWLKTNTFARGVHYKSAMECALRIPVFFTALKQIEDLNPDQYDLILEAIYLHGRFVSKHLSLYSSLGNHTITEAVGLIFAGATFKSTREGRHWIETGLRLLTDELPHQILDDGGPAEQSLNYHRFVLDLYWLAMDFIHKNNLGNVLQWKPRLSAGEFFLSAFQDGRGCFPSIGDSDDGFAIAPGISPLRDESVVFDDKLRHLPRFRIQHHQKMMGWYSPSTTAHWEWLRFTTMDMPMPCRSRCPKTASRLSLIRGPTATMGCPGGADISREPGLTIRSSSTIRIRPSRKPVSSGAAPTKRD